MAAALFNQLAEPSQARAISAGTSPGERVNPVVVEAMQEVGIDLSGAVPRELTAEVAGEANVLVTMGCGDDCPFVPGARTEDWPLLDPSGQPLEIVRQIRDEIRTRVQRLIQGLGIGGMRD